MQGERIFSGSPYEEKAGYARAAVAGGWIFVSGTTGFDAQTKDCLLYTSDAADE